MATNFAGASIGSTFTAHIMHNGEETIMPDYQKEILDAFFDVMDGASAIDLRKFTGLPEDRCKEIHELYWKLMDGEIE